MRSRRELQGGAQSRLHVPAELPRLGDRRLARRVPRAPGSSIERTRLGAYLRAATENPMLVQAFGINVPRMITLTYGAGVGAWRRSPASWRRRSTRSAR